MAFKTNNVIHVSVSFSDCIQKVCQPSTFHHFVIHGYG